MSAWLVQPLQAFRKAKNAGIITVDFGEGVTVGGVERKANYYNPWRSRWPTGGGKSHSIVLKISLWMVLKLKALSHGWGKVQNRDHITHEITLTGGKITWDAGTANETSATRTSHHFRKWTHNGDLIRSNDEVALLEGGTASGTNRDEVEYPMQITKDIVFKARAQ